jgi:beta-lactamase regulating signal transducer with metallopeptidase domain
MTLLSWLIKASVAVAVAALVQAALGRRMSAAMRHAIWALTMVGLLLLPVLSFTLPEWKIAQVDAQRAVASLSQRVTPTANAAIAGPSRSASQEPNAMFQWSIVLPGIYAFLVAFYVTVVAFYATVVAFYATVVAFYATVVAFYATVVAFYATVVAVLLARLTLQRLSIHRLAHRATDMTDRQWIRLLAECAAIVGVRRPVRLLTQTDQVMPAMFGIRRPAILLPAAADEWVDDRRRAVLLHELAHVARHDCLWQTFAAVACAVYWVHPGVWWIARRMRAERELACDDVVLSAGMSAYDYADHLLELAYKVPGQRMPAVAIEMASPGHLERRLVALLDGTRPRTVPARLTRLAAFALIVLMVAPISSAALSDGELAQAADDEQVMGLWEIRPASAGFVEVRLCHADLFAHSEILVREVDGLSEEWLSGANRPIRLTLRRDAGTFTLDGTVGRGQGSGTYAFVTGPRFPTDFESLGFKPPTPEMTARYPGLGTWTHTLALYDVGFDTLKTLRQQERTQLAWSEFVRMKQFHTQFEGMQQAIARAPFRINRWC